MASFLSTLITVGFFIFVILALASTAIKIVKEYERGVIFRSGPSGRREGSGPLLHHPFRG